MSMRADGKLVFSLGASRSGKSQFVLSQVQNAKRLLVWDVEGEYAAKYKLKVVEGKQALFDFVKNSNNDEQVAYHGNIKDFDFFCRMAFIWGLKKEVTVVCEELAASTNAVKAGGHWGILVSRGLKYGNNIYAVVQRGQETDNSLMGNATIVNICRPNTIQDAEYIAGKFGLSLSDIPDADLEMLQRHKNRTLTKTKLKFKTIKGKSIPYPVKIKEFSKHF